MTLNSSIVSPQHIFIFFSLLAGLVLVFLIPPIGSSDESAHIRRISEISEFVFINPDAHSDDPFSLWAENAFVMRKEYYAQKKSWHFSDIKNIGIEQPVEREIQIDKNILSLNNPIIYLPLAAGLKLAKIIFQPDYGEQFYILRLMSLFLSIALLTAAIARIPEHKTLLAAACLLPVMLYNRSGINVDGVTIGFTALFLVQIHNLCRKNSLITFLEKIYLFFWGFLMAQSKGAYLPLLFLVFLLPKENFSSARDRWFTIFLIIIPALLCSFGWSGYAKHEILSGTKYFTEGTLEVWPDGQFAWIISHPFSFASVLLETIFATPFIPNSILQMVGVLGWNGFAISTFPILVLILLLFAISASEPVASQLYPSLTNKIFLLIICAASFALMLTMLYVQWTGYKSDVVLGFQGRYFYPLLPILVVFAKPVKDFVNRKRAIILLWIFAFVSSTSVLWATYTANY